MHRQTAILLGVFLALAACQGRDPRVGFPFRIRDNDLVRTGRPEEVVLRGVTFESGRSAADVRFPQELVVAGNRPIGAIVLTANRQDLVVFIDATEPAAPRFSAALTLPMGIRVEFSPDGRYADLIHEKDLYLPPESEHHLAPRTVRVDTSSLTWFESIVTGLISKHRDARWF